MPGRRTGGPPASEAMVPAGRVHDNPDVHVPKVTLSTTFGEFAAIECRSKVRVERCPLVGYLFGERDCTRGRAVLLLYSESRGRGQRWTVRGLRS